MSKFHTTVSRRTFMKGLGLTGAGLGAAAAATPVFHDLDEAVSSIRAGSKHPWYVKEREHLDPSNEWDWSQIKRTFRGAVLDNTGRNEDKNENVKRTKEMKRAGRDHEFTKEKFPSYVPDSRQGALTQAGNFTRTFSQQFLGTVTINKTTKAMKGPDELTMEGGQKFAAPWRGTPEENLRLMTFVARFFGGAELGVVELNEKTRNLIFSKAGSKTYEFEDVDQAYETDTKMVIPNKCNRVIVWTNLQPTRGTLTQPGGASMSTLTYDRMYKMSANLHAFLHGLGYQHLDGTSSSLSPSAPFGILAGIGEHSRPDNIVTSYKYGNTIRGMNRIITDMPLALTRPIDAGTFKFCATCGICARACPYDALDKTGGPRWDHWAEDEEANQNYSNVGAFNGFRMSRTRCPKCRSCQAACPFNSSAKAMIHQLVETATATTSVFNAFLSNMSDVFGYGHRNPNDYWDIDISIYDLDTSFTVR